MTAQSNRAIKQFAIENKKALLREHPPLGETLQKMRLAANLSQTSLGELLSLHQTAICRIEQGTQSLSPEDLFLIAKFFEVRIDSMIIGEVNYSKIQKKFKA